MFTNLTKLTLLVFLAFPAVLFASDGSAINSGDTAWIITATALVLFMTLPGLALFYGGLVRSKNYLSVLMHNVAIACFASVLWVICLYSIAFTEGNAYFGDLSKAFLSGINQDSVSGTIPELLFVGFQMTFAIITPALIIGAFVERMKFTAVLLFTGLWLFLVYAPVTHWVWGGGWLSQMGVIDFAGGLVVHATAGISALILAKVLMPRMGFPNRLSVPHQPGLVMIGASMLWVGWFGFNAGSQLAADGQAAMSLLVTHISASVASLTWMAIEWKKNGKPGLVGIVTGTIAGLATITPASGSVGPMGAIIIGFSAGVVCYYMCSVIKGALKIDDSLDVFAVHGVGGILGTLLVAFLAADKFGGNGGGDFDALAQLKVQAIGVGAVVAWSAIATIIIIAICKLVTGLRVSEECETIGLDESEHGENAYNID
ncbi:MAG: ammonium transporter [Coraliomargaritaceae bacterium]